MAHGDATGASHHSAAGHHIVLNVDVISTVESHVDGRRQATAHTVLVHHAIGDVDAAGHIRATGHASHLAIGESAIVHHIAMTFRREVDVGCAQLAVVGIKRAAVGHQVTLATVRAKGDTHILHGHIFEHGLRLRTVQPDSQRRTCGIVGGSDSGFLHISLKQAVHDDTRLVTKLDYIALIDFQAIAIGQREVALAHDDAATVEGQSLGEAGAHGQHIGTIRGHCHTRALNLAQIGKGVHFGLQRACGCSQQNESKNFFHKHL